MNGEVESLWPDTLEALAPIRTPTTLLKEQAAELGRQMKNIVVANVRNLSGMFGVDISDSFSLSAPTFSSYEYELFTTSYDPIALYPVTVRYRDRVYQSADETDLKERMKKIFADPQTLKIIQALLSQATEKSSKLR